MISKYKPGFTAEHRKNRPDIRSTENDQAGTGSIDSSADTEDDETPTGEGPLVGSDDDDGDGTNRKQ